MCANSYGTRKRLETIPRQHKCTSTTIGKILPPHDRIGEISDGRSTDRLTSLDDDEMEKLDQLIKI